jgi:hypothetical protein
MNLSQVHIPINKFKVVGKNKGCFLVEAKIAGACGLNPILCNFQAQTGAKRAFQLAFDLSFVEQNCFGYTPPFLVPAAPFFPGLFNPPVFRLCPRRNLIQKN